MGEAERAVNAGSQKRRPLPLSEDSETETEGSSAMLFPSTPNAENEMSFGAGVPGTQWTPSTPAAPESITVLPPVFWAPPAAVLDNESSPAAVPATCFMPG